jgi:hypothetical protein
MDDIQRMRVPNDALNEMDMAEEVTPEQMELRFRGFKAIFRSSRTR